MEVKIPNFSNKILLSEKTQKDILAAFKDPKHPGKRLQIVSSFPLKIKKFS
jgi:hypothetical protein